MRSVERREKVDDFDPRFLLALNILGLLLSVPLLGVGIYVATRHYCSTFLAKPIIALGALLVVVSVAGILSAFCRLSWLVWVHLVALFLLVLVLLCFAIFTLDITSQGGGRTLPGKAYSEYFLDDYPKWMRGHMLDRSHWKSVVKCLKNEGVCGPERLYSGTDSNVFYRTKLTPSQSGCCKPPDYCNFQFVNATTWNGPSYDVHDCYTWNNDQSQLCYDCDSCRAGVIQAIKDGWKNAGITVFVVVFVAIVMYALFICLAFESGKGVKKVFLPPRAR